MRARWVPLHRALGLPSSLLENGPGPQTLLSPRAPRAIPKLPSSPFLGHQPWLSAGRPPPSRAASRTPFSPRPHSPRSGCCSSLAGPTARRASTGAAAPAAAAASGAASRGGGGASACLTASPATNSLRPPRRSQSRREGGASAAAGQGQPRARQAGGFDRRWPAALGAARAPLRPLPIGDGPRGGAAGCRTWAR